MATRQAGRADDAPAAARACPRRRAARWATLAATAVTGLWPATAAHAHGGITGELASFGGDWWYMAVPLAVLAGLGGVLMGLAPRPRRGRVEVAPLVWLADGAARVTRLPPWVAGALAVLLAGLLMLVLGFFWDVAWHIAIGRDEFLLSPPHVTLLAGILLVGAGGLMGVVMASHDEAPVAWRRGRLRVPAGAAPLLAATAIAVGGFTVDELWHWAYGLDVTMWSPPHLLMIVPMSLSPLGGWLMLAEASRHHRAGDRIGGSLRLGWALAGAALLGLSAYQLEFDLAVPQWPQAYHPILLALAGGFGLTAARAGLGPGGALAAVAYFWGLRGLLFGATAGLWGLGEPRIPLYAAGAVGVELVWRAARRRGWSPARTAVGAGAAMATLGLAGEAAWSHVWAWHPWQAAILPWLPVAAAVAVAAAWLGAAFGRLVSDRPAGISWRSAAAALAVVLAGLAVPLPRGVPDGEVVLRTRDAGSGWVDVTVETDPPDLAEGADRFEVLSWQGGGSQIAPLVPAGGGTFTTRRPVPAYGDWKSIVRLARGRDLGGLPVYQPADSFVDAAEVPVVDRRAGPLVADERLLLREAHAGPAWPAVVGYAALAAGTAAVLALLTVGATRVTSQRRLAEPEIS